MSAIFCTDPGSTLKVVLGAEDKGSNIDIENPIKLSTDPRKVGVSSGRKSDGGN